MRLTKKRDFFGMKGMTITRAHGCLLGLALGLTGMLGASPGFEAFMKNHCFECHGEKKQKGKLRLDTLGAPTAIGETGDQWLEVLHVLKNGDMPPEEEKQPEKKELEAMVALLDKVLTESTEPPIGLRRMNRVEYEHTVQDLLGITTPLRDLLPEDGEVDGFDNVADGLGISSILMERYLEAADVAFDDVIRRFPPLPAETRRLQVMERKDNIDSVAKKKGGVIEVEGALVKFTPGWPPVRIDEVHPI